MSHFYGSIRGNRGAATRGGSKSSGFNATAASWSGAIETILFIDDKGRNCFRVEQIRHHGKGVIETLASGVIGELGSVPYRGMEPIKRGGNLVA